MESMKLCISNFVYRLILGSNSAFMIDYPEGLCSRHVASLNLGK